MTETRVYSARSYHLGMLFWILITLLGFGGILSFNYFVAGIGVAVSVLGVLGLYSTIWIFRERRRVSGDWSDLR